MWNINENGIRHVLKDKKVFGVSWSKLCLGKSLLTQPYPPMSVLGATCPSFGYIQRNYGYISAKLFADYEESFVKFLRKSNLMTTNARHIMLLDLHRSHVFTSNYMECIKANRIEIQILPALSHLN